MTVEILDVEEVTVSEKDIREVAELMVHPEIMRWDTDYRSHTTDAQELLPKLRESFKRTPSDEDQLCLLARSEGKVVGFLGIHRFGGSKPHIGDVGIMVDPDYQGKGIGTKLLKGGIELARDKGFKRLEADTLATNKAMRRTAEKAGFQLEGIRRKCANMHGQLKDEALYALLLTANNGANHHELNVVIRGITENDIERVHEFVVSTQGPAENECDKRYLEALMKKGWLQVEGMFHFPEKKDTAPSKADYLRWIVDNEGLHFGKIALSNESIVGVLLCYTQSGNRKAYLSNIAVDSRHRRKGIGSTLMKNLIDFYKNKSDIEFIETNTGYTNGIAVKFYLKHNFRIVELRDTGYTMQYALRNARDVRELRESARHTRRGTYARRSGPVVTDR